MNKTIRLKIIEKLNNSRRRKIASNVVQRNGRPRTIENVTLDKLWCEGRITEGGWAFLRELADYIQCKYYPFAKDKGDLVQKMILKGAEQIVTHIKNKGTPQEYAVKNWKNFVFTGMRNTASNTQYHENKEVNYYDVVDDVTMNQCQEKYYESTRETEDIENIDVKTNEERIKDLNNMIICINGDEDKTVLKEAAFALVWPEKQEKHISKKARRLVVLSKWNERLGL